MKSIIKIPYEITLYILLFLNNYELMIIEEYVANSIIYYKSSNIFSLNKTTLTDYTNKYNILNLYKPLNLSFSIYVDSILNFEYFKKYIKNRSHPVVFNCLENWCDKCNSKGNIFFYLNKNEKKGKLNYIQCNHT